MLTPSLSLSLSLSFALLFTVLFFFYLVLFACHLALLCVLFALLYLFLSVKAKTTNPLWLFSPPFLFVVFVVCVLEKVGLAFVMLYYFLFIFVAFRFYTRVGYNSIFFLVSVPRQCFYWLLCIYFISLLCNPTCANGRHILLPFAIEKRFMCAYVCTWLCLHLHK